MSHSVKVMLIADQVIKIKGQDVNIHDIGSVVVDAYGQITEVYLKSGEENDGI